MNYEQLLEFEANQHHEAFSNEKYSQTLEVGFDCLNYTFANIKRALKTFPQHSTEIILTDLHIMLFKKEVPIEDVFKRIVKLTKLSDKYMSLR